MTISERPQSFEVRLLEIIREASNQIQIEEGFSWAEEPLRCLGMDWYQATELEAVFKALKVGRETSLNMPVRGRALIASLSILLSELFPVILMGKREGSAGISNYLFDKEVIKNRLKNNFLINWSDLERQSSQDTPPTSLPALDPKIQKQISERWEKELLPPALHLVLAESDIKIGAELRQDLLSGETDRVKAKAILNAQQEALIEKLSIVLKEGVVSASMRS